MTTDIREAAKKEIQRLIDLYKDLKRTGKYESFNEDETCRKLILPLFHALGWDTTADKISDEVTGQETAGGQKRVDYAFNINGQAQFYLEAKSLREDINDPKFAEQAIHYGYNKTIRWVVLSNFEGTRVFNSSSKARQLSEKTVIDLTYDKYLDNLETLWLLSKESVAAGGLNEYAKKFGHVENKVPVNELLLKKLLIWRDKLLKEVSSERKDLKEEAIHECVQKLLNRLIFIRTCEDRKIDEPNILRNILKECQNDTSKSPWPLVLEVFRKFEKGYDSSLFEMHEIDKTKISLDLIWDVISSLYEDPKEDVKFDFAVIPDDILGKIYEQYLGIIQKGENLAGKEKRKSHGIYYTPKYIVDYIVENTLGKVIEELLKNKEYEKIGQLKVLDPACGSGSFLLKSLQVFDDAYAQTPADKDFSKIRKLKALATNIYGVDLDDEAVELTKLNLLLSAVSARRKLPNLDQHIECGNSLIDDPKIAGDKAFKWETRFKEVMDKGGFDVIIGNPPYVKARDAKDVISRKYIEESGKYETPYKMWDLYIAFVEKGLKLLKPNGVFAMIIPDTIGVADYTQKLVSLIIKKYSLYQIDFFPDIAIFEGVGVRNKIIFIINSTSINKCKRIVHGGKLENAKSLDISDNRKPEVFRLMTSKVDFDFNNTVPLGHICYVSYGARFNSDKADPIKFTKSDLISELKDSKHNHIYTEGKYLQRYNINKTMYVEWGTTRSPGKLVRPTFPELYPPNKLLMSRQKRVTAFSDKGHICDNTIIVGVPYDDIKAVKNSSINKYLNNIKLDRGVGEKNSLKYNIKYLLAILNSKLISYYLNANSRSKIDSYPDDWKTVPVMDISLNEQKPLMKLANKMLDLNGQYDKIKDKQTSETERLKRQIEDADKEINQLVYKLYELTKEEILVVEGEK
jgi:type I restriction-modification system DNA methylase subunit